MKDNTITVRKFELNDTVARFTETKDFKKCRFVIQNTKTVKKMFVGLEAFAMPYLWNTMKQNEFALVFDEESKKLLGYISKNENGIPTRYIETEELYFSDMYDTVED